MDHNSTDKRSSTSKSINIIADFYNVVIERLKNPYILAFSISWLAWNWRAIAILLFSIGDIEFKILYINIYHSDILHYLILPLISTFIYLFAVPLLNHANEWFLIGSTKKRRDYVKNEIKDALKREEEIEIADDAKQKAIAIARESKEHNKYVEDLLKSIAESNANLVEERQRFTSQVATLQQENNKLSKENSELYSNSESSITSLKSELVFVRTALAGERQKLEILEKNLLNEANFKSDNLTGKIKSFINARLEHPKNKILVIAHSQFLELFTDNNDVHYFNLKNSMMATKSEIFTRIQTNGFSQIEEIAQVNLAEKQIFDNLSLSERVTYFGRAE